MATAIEQAKGEKGTARISVAKAASADNNIYNVSMKINGNSNENKGAKAMYENVMEKPNGGNNGGRLCRLLHQYVKKHGVSNVEINIKMANQRKSASAKRNQMKARIS